MHDCTVYTERAETAAVSRGTSHVTTEQHCRYTTSVDIQNALYIYKKIFFFFLKRCPSFRTISELKSCVKVVVAVLGAPSLISLMVSVDVKQH